MRARVTVVDQTTYQSDEVMLPLSDQPYSFSVTSDERPYQRVYTVNEDWQPLDTGWVKEPHMLIVRNLPSNRATYPTKEEANEAASAVVDLAVDMVIFGCVPVGESVRMYPITQLFARSRKGTAKISVTAVPK